MSTTPTSDSRDQLARLRAQLDDCLLRDAHEQGRRLAKLNGRARSGKPIDRSLRDIEARLARSREQLAARRAQPLTLRYPDDLPVAERREDLLAALDAHQVVVQPTLARKSDLHR